MISNHIVKPALFERQVQFRRKYRAELDGNEQSVVLLLINYTDYQRNSEGCAGADATGRFPRKFPGFVVVNENFSV